jgi:hypothetical protein
MANEEIFNDVLDEGEKVAAVLTPNRKKYWAFFNWVYFWCLPSWFVPAIALMTALIFADKEVKNAGLSAGILIAAAIGIMVLAYLIAFWLAKVTLKKRFYGYSNKRILIRCGIIGVDYKVLDYKLLGATTATVGLLDKIMGSKTGYLRFGSASSPIITASFGGQSLGGGFVFSHVDNPYELLREIKKTINQVEK